MPLQDIVSKTQQPSTIFLHFFLGISFDLVYLTIYHLPKVARMEADNPLYGSSLIEYVSAL
jgi:hypothetical protein